MLAETGPAPMEPVLEKSRPSIVRQKRLLPACPEAIAAAFASGHLLLLPILSVCEPASAAVPCRVTPRPARNPFWVMSLMHRCDFETYRG